MHGLEFFGDFARKPISIQIETVLFFRLQSQVSELPFKPEYMYSEY